ncbi:hypothetical protein C0991_005759 [Blastosporella zonata]|nr:hypothetical protein C0991_005759 [Blastosporella zonata]
MGRALFSTLYTSPVAVRIEPDILQQADIPRCEKWSISNPFDPDSDEFYESATREVFTDTEAWRQEQEAVRELLAAQAEGGIEIPTSSEASENDTGSPMAVGSDDPALLIAGAVVYPMDANWTPPSPMGKPNRNTETLKQAQLSILPDDTPENYHSLRVIGHRRSSTASSIGYIPPSPQAAPATAAPAPISPPRSPTLRRAHAIIPISIPNELSSPSPTSPVSPSTPTDDLFHREMMSMLTPSPVPSVTPHIYNWHMTPLVSPSSPLDNMAGPLTNPNARMSLARLNIAPTRIRAQNAAV